MTKVSHFEAWPPTHALTITQPFSGTGAGTVTATGVNCPGDCSEAMAENTVVALTATPAADSTFVSWGGAADCADGRVTMSADRACTASFSVVDEPGEPAGYLLTVSQKGTGTGIVTSNPHGIDCGDDCTESYASATAVTLSALPAADSAFAGWGGDSACADGTVAMTADRACRASFSMVDDPESVNRWLVTSVPYYINPANADVPRGRARRAIQEGASAWSLQSNADIEFSYAGKTSAASVGLDSTNNVFFRPDSNGSAIASAYYWVDSTGTILDSDIVFWDGGVTLFTGRSGCSDGAYIEDITAHEVGHALGLRHSIVEGATMFESYSLCSTEPRSLAGDDITAVEALYIPAGAEAPPADPSALVAASNSREPTSAIDLSWNDDADNEDGYSVERSTTNSDYLEIQQVGANTTAYTDAGLASGTTYWYRVRAFGAGGNSGYANSASAHTDFPGVDPPADDPTDPTLEDALQDIVDSNPGTSLANKVEDALGKVQDARKELAKTPPNNQGALGNFEGAAGELDAAVSEGLDPVQGAVLMDDVAGMARMIAKKAIEDAIARHGHSDKISDAQQFLEEGDALRTEHAFKDAVARYKDAVASAEGA